MSKSYRFSADQQTEQRNKSKAIKQDQKQLGRINKQFLRSINTGSVTE
jgi:hypothetical protein